MLGDALQGPEPDRDDWRRFRLIEEENSQLRAEVERWRVAATREGRENIFSGEELLAANKLGNEICGYIEKCRRNLQLDGGIRAGVDHIIRHNALPWLSQRPRLITGHATKLKD